MFTATLNNSNILINLLKSICNMSIELSISITTKGLNFKGYSESSKILYTAELHSKLFSEYYSKDEIKFKVFVKDLLLITTYFTNEEVPIIIRIQDSKLMTIKFMNIENSVSLFPDDIKYFFSIDVFSSNLKIKRNDFINIISQLSMLGNISIDITINSLQFYSANHVVRCEITYESGKINLKEFKSELKNSFPNVTYSIYDMKKVIKSETLSEELIIDVGTEYTLLIESKFCEFANISYFINPTICEND